MGKLSTAISFGHRHWYSDLLMYISILLFILRHSHCLKIIQFTNTVNGLCV